ncbi:MAG: carboxypeptidase-like regulatory domain-containing protein [Bryobacterales bacterium]
MPSLRAVPAPPMASHAIFSPRHVALIALLSALLFSATAAAQELRGRVQGIVSDSSGAVIPAARVTLRNVNTNVETLRETGATGQYVFDQVLPGSYELRVEVDGFRSFVQQNILVQTRADVTVNAALEVGAIAETVTVEESPVAVSFNQTTMETTLDTKMANELPIIHRNPFLLAQLDPAVVYRGNQETSPYHHWAASQLDVGGNTSYKNNVLLDGVPQLVGAKGTYVPAMDAVSEVNVQQNAVDAEYGHSAGGIVSVQMKSGTNDWHGSAYYLGRNPVFNARPNPLTAQESIVRRSVWGVTSGNPIVANKVFNFFAYEGQNTRQPLTLTRTLPTQLEQGGDFSNSLNRNGGVRMIHDPFTTQITGSNTSTREPFANNVIPQSRLDPTAVTVMGEMFEPNNPGDNVAGLNNFRYTYPQEFKYYNFSDRVDWNVSENVRVFGRISRFHTDQVDPDFTNGSILQPRAGSERHTWQSSGDIVWTVNPTTVFNVRGSWSKITDRFSAPEVEIGEAGLERLWPGNQWYTSHVRDIPTVYHPEIIANAESTSAFGRSGYWFQEPQTYNWDVKLSKQAGRHYLKFGHQYRAQRVEAARPQGMQFTFRPEETADTIFAPQTATVGHAYASMMLGVIGGGRGVATVPVNRPNVDVFGFYVHDDFKISQNVTLNLGVRYEYETAMRDPEYRLSRYMDFNQALPELASAMAPFPEEAMALRRQPLNIAGAWIFTDQDNPGTWNAQKNIILPRAGLAIRLNDRTALRIGYARYAIPPIQGRDALATHAYLDPLGSTPYTGFTATTAPQGLLQGVPRAILSDPYPSSGANPNPLVEPAGKANGIYAVVGTGGGEGQFFQQNFRQGINDRVNVSLQREIFSRIIVDATFFMNFGHNHPVNRNVNMADPRIGFDAQSAINQSVPNPFFGLPANIVPGPLRNQRNVNVSQLIRPYPFYTDINLLGEGVGGQRYNAFQLKIQRPFANGFNFLLGYNNNRGKAQEYYDEVDQFDQTLDYQRDTYSGQTLTLGGIFELPFGRGRRFGGGAPKALNAIFGGWSISGIYRFQSGQLLSFRTNPAVVSGDPVLDNPTRQRWFNTDAFSRLPAFTRRSNPWIFDDLRGPSYSNLDMTLNKLVPITERLKLELRMEAYNLSNSFMGQNPITDVNSGSFGAVTAQLVTHSGRELQYSLRLIW